MSPNLRHAVLFLGIMASMANAGGRAAKGSLLEDIEASPLMPDFTAVVARDAGLWPQLQVTPDGTLLAFGYNAAAHTTLPADVDCWASDDGGRSWSKRGTAAPRPATDANYCHWASGFSEKQELLVVVSGMDDAANASGKRQPNYVRVFRSADFGKTWRAEGKFPTRLPGELKPYPFGSIVQGSDGSLRTLVYSVNEQPANAEAAWMITSNDDGRSWGEPVKVADGINESVLMRLAGKGWLCVARTSNRPAPELGQELRQFRSTDDGRTWTDEGLIAGYHKHPPHLLRLRDQRLLLTYGNRRDGSIEARLSADDGQSWDTPYKLYTTGPGDMGYPSTTQLPDGKLVTVFYAAQSPLHAAYHMGAIGWNAPAKKSGPVAIGGRRELFLDNTLVENLAGGAQRVFHRPAAREVVIKFDQPWEGETSGNVTVFQDGDQYRMYYLGGGDAQREVFACYAESRDGIQWAKPNLGLFEFNGSKENNIVWKGVAVGAWVPFKDENPRCPAEARYKAVGLRVTGEWDAGAVKELMPFHSADGIHWKLTSDKGILNDGYFDSQNVVFWDPNTQNYRAYYRIATQTFANKNNWGRDIMMATSPDFLQWPKGKLVQHVRKPSAQFYNNVIRPYHRAPHIYLGFPGMYDDRGAATKELLPQAQALLPDGEIRRRNVAEWQRFGPLSDTQLMWSREGASFELAPSTFMPPGPERSGSWTYADHVGWHLVETASVYQGASPELTLYSQEFYYVDAVQLRRHTLRLDGFASIHAPLSGGELITPPLIFQGASLSLNFATSAFGWLRIEVQDADGRPLPGFTLADSIELYGDTVARMAMWKDNPILSAYAGTPVRLRFVMSDADLYAFQFQGE